MTLKPPGPSPTLSFRSRQERRRADMSTRTKLDRLAAARPAILRRTEEVVDAAEEGRIIREFLFATGGGAAPPDVPSPVRARSLSRTYGSFEGRSGVWPA